MPSRSSICSQFYKSHEQGSQSAYWTGFQFHEDLGTWIAITAILNYWHQFGGNKKIAKYVEGLGCMYKCYISEVVEILGAVGVVWSFVKMKKVRKDSSIPTLHYLLILYYGIKRTRFVEWNGNNQVHWSSLSWTTTVGVKYDGTS